MAKEAAPADGGSKSAIGDKIKALLPLMFIVLNLGVASTGAYFVFLSTVGWTYPALTEEEEAKELGKAREEKKESPIMYTMDKFTVNLDGTPRRIIQTEISVEMLDGKGFEEVVTLGGQARDSIVKLLNGKSFSDVETIQGKLFLKDQIASTLNQLLHNGVVKDVYFSQFVVQ